MKNTQHNTHDWLDENIATIAGYLRQGFDIYVYAHGDGDTEKLDYTPLSTNTRWNPECPNKILYIFPHFEGGAPDMVNDFWDLLDEDEAIDACNKDMDVAEYLRSIGSSINARQIELWLDMVNYDDYEVGE